MRRCERMSEVQGTPPHVGMRTGKRRARGGGEPREDPGGGTGRACFSHVARTTLFLGTWLFRLCQV